MKIDFKVLLMKILQIMMAVSLFTFTSHLHAGGPFPNNGYLGAGLGAVKSSSDNSNLIISPSRCEEVDSMCSIDDDNLGLKFFVGYELSKNISIEGFYTELDKVVESKVQQDNISDEYVQSTHGFGLALVGRYQPAPNLPLSLKAKVGIFHWISEADGTFSPIVNGFDSATSRKDSGTSPMLSLGVEYSVSPSWDIYGEWDRYFGVGESDTFLTEATSTWRTLKTDVDFLSIGVKYNF